MRRPEVADETKALAFWFGVLLLLVVIGFVWHADITPWFNLDSGFGDGNDW